MASFPEKAESVLLVNDREIEEATPRSLWRKNNQAAVLDFEIPRRTFLSLRDIEGEFRQGSIVQLFYGKGTGQQRIFYGYLPSVLSDRNLSETNTTVRLIATDFIGQLEDRAVELGTSSSSFLIPEGKEIGGLVADIVQNTIDAQFAAPLFSIQGIQGTSPVQVVSAADAKTGVDTAKNFIDYYTGLAFDDTAYPNAPLLYEYQQRDQYFVWRKEKALTSNAALRLTVGKDAIISGTIQRQPIYSDAHVSGVDAARWSQSDRDTARRWGGRRFWIRESTTSSFVSDAYEKAVRLIELSKNERRSFSLIVGEDAFFLHPGDIVALDGAEDIGIKSETHRISEVRIGMTPTLRTTLTLGDAGRLLTDYLTG